MIELEGAEELLCLHCMVLTIEHCWVKDDSTAYGIRCPNCGRGDALINIADYDLIPQDAS